MPNVPKDCCINYDTAEFLELSQLEKKKFENGLDWLCKTYHFDKMYFKSRPYLSGRQSNIEIQYEVAPLLSLILEANAEKQVFKSTKKHKITEITEFNKKQIDKIEKLPPYLKNLIKNETTYWQVYQMSSLLPMLIERFAMLFATIAHFEANLAQNMVGDIIKQLDDWIDNIFLHNYQLKMAEAQIKDKSSERESARINLGTDGLPTYGGQCPLYLIDEVIITVFSNLYNRDSEIGKEFQSLHQEQEELEQLKGKNVPIEKIIDLRQRYLTALNNWFQSMPILTYDNKGKEEMVTHAEEQKRIDETVSLFAKRYSSEEIKNFDTKFKTIVSQTLHYFGKFNYKNENEDLEKLYSEIEKIKREKIELFQELCNMHYYKKIYTHLDDALGNHIIEILEKEQARKERALGE